MTPPEAPIAGSNAAGDSPPAVSVCLKVISNRADFLRAARAKRQGTSGMMVQAHRRNLEELAGDIRVGFTCSKKVGNAIARNRAKRRLREVARLVLPEHGKPGWDYVLIGKPDITASRSFSDLQSDLKYALRKIHGGSVA